MPPAGGFFFLHAPAVTLPCGRPKGGVALVVPSRFTVESHSIPVDGCVLSELVRDKAGGDAFTVMVVYMPPGDQRIRVARSLASLPYRAGDTFAVGDFNYDLCQTRDAKEEEIQGIINEWLLNQGHLSDHGIPDPAANIHAQRHPRRHRCAHGTALEVGRRVQMELFALRSRRRRRTSV